MRLRLIGGKLSNIYSAISQKQKMKAMENLLMVNTNTILLLDMYLRSLEEVLLSKAIFTKEELESIRKKTTVLQSVKSEEPKIIA